MNVQVIERCVARHFAIAGCWGQPVGEVANLDERGIQACHNEPSTLEYSIILVRPHTQRRLQVLAERQLARFEIRRQRQRRSEKEGSEPQLGREHHDDGRIDSVQIRGSATRTRYRAVRPPRTAREKREEEMRKQARVVVERSCCSSEPTHCGRLPARCADLPDHCSLLSLCTSTASKLTPKKVLYPCVKLHGL